MKKQYIINELNLYAEWSLWSKCFGKVVVINGTSSSGKTTLSQHMSKFGFNIINVDEICDQILFDYFNKVNPNLINEVLGYLRSHDLRKMWFKYKVNKDKYKDAPQKYITDLENYIKNSNTEDISEELFSDKNICSRVYCTAKKFIFSGQNIVIDTVFTSNQEINFLSFSFNYYKISILLLYSPLEENLERCYSRNKISLQQDLCDYRPPAQVIEQYLLFYKFKDKIENEKKVLEKVNKSQVIKVLNNITPQNEELFYQIYNPDYYSVASEKVAQANTFVEEVYTAMQLGNETDVFVTTDIKYDHILKDNTATNEIATILGDILGHEVQ